MAFKLKDLIITKVDFVDAGANQRANIMLLKRAPEGGESEMTEKKEPNAVQKFLQGIAKHLGLAEEETAAAVAEIAKGEGMTFSETLDDEKRQRINCEVYETTEALARSFYSILRDDELDNNQRREKLQQSLDEFNAMAGGFIVSWANGQLAGIKKRDVEPTEAAEVEKAKTCKEKTCKEDEEPEEPDVETDENGLPTESTPKKVDEEQKKKPCAKSAPAEEDTEMQINKSLLNEQEVAFLEEIEKKAGVQEEAPAAEPAEVEKAAPAQEPDAEQELADVMKNVPAVAEVLKTLEEKVAKMEDQELLQVAKKYEILGINSEEMVATLKSLKATPKAYDAVLKKFDAAVAAVEKSGVFEEIGKRGAESTEGDAWARIEKHAEKMREADPSMGYHASIDKACMEHPELVHEYEG